MKNKYLFLLLIFVILFSLHSCSKFLEETSKDEIIPNSSSDYKELIYGEIYNKTNLKIPHPWLDIMTDDCEEFAKKASLGSDTRGAGYGYFTWQQKPELQQVGTLSDDCSWETYYHHILVANMILYDVDQKEGSDSEIAQVKAEAYMIRAYAYFMLVNLYGEPYSPATAAAAKGVPLNNLVGAENAKFKRVSVAENYRVIDENIEKALVCFEQSKELNSIFRWNKNAALLFASRVALYTHNWDNVIRYANDALHLKSTLWDLNEKLSQGAESVGDYFFTRRNPEIAFSYGYYYINFFASGAKGAYPVSTSLKAMYVTGDLRYAANDGAFIRNQGNSFFGGGKRYLQYKYFDSGTTGIFGFAIRTAEAYLNRAEAYAMKGDLKNALDDLNFLRKYRFTAAKYGVLSSDQQEEVLQMVKDERRRELCFEQLRWFDLRRWDRPSITHIYTPNFADLNTRDTYVLEKDDPAYTLPIPTSILVQDSDLEDIHRAERNPKI